jgi:NAD(P)-dependent dehydrogenase (short-subunit alcohol dehydrogenase family)
VAVRIAKEGGRVVLNGSGTNDPEATHAHLEALAREIEHAGGEVATCVGSVACDEGARALIGTAVDRFGGLDALVNCAGIPEPPNTTIRDITPEDWQKVLAVHLDGSFLWCREAIPHLIEAGGGAIVNTSSHAWLGLYGGTAYGASKGAINSLTWELAADLREHGIRCNAICPGAKTRLSSGPRYAESIGRLVERGLLSPEMGRASIHAPPPEGCASLYAYLVSDAAREITGELFSATGGYVGVFARPQERLLLFKQPPDGQSMETAGALRWELDDLADRLPDQLASVAPGNSDDSGGAGRDPESPRLEGRPGRA